MGRWLHRILAAQSPKGCCLHLGRELYGAWGIVNGGNRDRGPEGLGSGDWVIMGDSASDWGHLGLCSLDDSVLKLT